MRVSPPLWLSSPIISWIPCQVVGELDPQGYVVEVKIDGEERSIVAPREFVRGVEGNSFPVNGELRVMVIAELPDDDRMLAELPTPPLNGSQRVKGSPAALQVA